MKSLRLAALFLLAVFRFGSTGPPDCAQVLQRFREATKDPAVVQKYCDCFCMDFECDEDANRIKDVFLGNTVRDKMAECPENMMSTVKDTIKEIRKTHPKCVKEVIRKINQVDPTLVAEFMLN